MRKFFSNLIVACRASHCVQKPLGPRPSDGMERDVDNLKGIPPQTVWRGAGEENVALILWSRVQTNTQRAITPYTHTQHKACQHSPQCGVGSYVTFLCAPSVRVVS